MSIQKDIEDEVEEKEGTDRKESATTPEELVVEGEQVLGAEHFEQFDELLGAVQGLQRAIEARDPDEVKALAARVKESGVEVKKIGFIDRFLRGRADAVKEHMETAGQVAHGLGMGGSASFLKGVFGEGAGLEKITPLLQKLGGSQGSIKGLLGNPEIAGSLGDSAPAATEALAGLEEIAPLLEEAGPLAAAL